MRNLLVLTLGVLVWACATSPGEDLGSPRRAGPASDPLGELRVEIRTPSSDLVLSSEESQTLVEGGASVFGGVRFLDLLFVLDTSKSLQRTDPRDYRSIGAVGLIESLPTSSNIQIGVVDFDSNGELLLPLTRDRRTVARALRGLNQVGRTNLAAGIRTALAEFERAARPDSSRVILLFTDGKSDDEEARRAAEEARGRGVAIHTLLLGSNKKGSAILREIADRTAASFLRVTDPAKLPEAFLSLRTTGVESVTLRVNDSPPIPTRLSGGTFSASVPLKEGHNRVVAIATSIDGRSAESVVTVTVRPPGCAELQVTASRDGSPALSISDRSVAMVVDASNSMWAQMEGRSKMEVAREILQDALDWLPNDLTLALRAYGHRHPRELHNCMDSELLVPFSSGDRGAIRDAISGLRPRGQTPISYSLEQIAHDFGDLEGERAVVLVTDGIESCGGDPVEAARRLGDRGISVHVIGFGLRSDLDQDTASLQAIAEASGGRFLTARSAEELREALAITVGTAFRVLQGDEVVARGALGGDQASFLPEGDYRVQLDSAPPIEVPVQLAREEGLTLSLERAGVRVSQSMERYPVQYTACDEPGPVVERGADAAPQRGAANYTFD